jgi:ABC-type phosphate transport system substrate-binding protein
MEKKRMKVKKKISIVSVSMFALFSIASCTPPIPPDVLASFAEKDVQCASGEVKVGSSEVAAIAVQSSIDLYLSYCPEANVTTTTEVAEANLIVTDYSAKEPEMCSTASVITPVMSKTSTLAYFISGFDGLVFSPETVQSIISGEITNLNDSQIAATNENFEFIDQPITLLGINQPSASDIAYLEWVGRQTGKDVTEVKAAESFDEYSALVEKLLVTEGAFAVLPSNVIYDNVITFSNLRIQDVDVLFETTSFGSAASQFVTEVQGDVLKVKLDPSITPQLDAGQESTSSPWQGISLFDVGMCTADDEEQSVRKFMRFLLRLDNQGQFETFGYFPLTESVRLQAAGIIGKVLPTPTIDPATLD